MTLFWWHASGDCSVQMQKWAKSKHTSTWFVFLDFNIASENQVKFTDAPFFHSRSLGTMNRFQASTSLEQLEKLRRGTSMIESLNI